MVVKIKGRKAKKCETEVAFNKGTWLGGSRLNVEKIVELTFMIVMNEQSKKIVKELRVAPVTVANWKSFARQVMVDWIMEVSEPIGGEGKVVEIDESKFGKRKYNRGRRVEGQWIFGGVERGSGKMFMVPVEKSDRETLEPIIRQYIRPGTKVISDCWKAYDNLNQIHYQHFNINHSQWFVDPLDKEIHTNTIEGAWAHAKAFMPRYHRVKKQYIGYLAHYMFYKHCAANMLDPFETFLRLTKDIEFRRYMDEDDGAHYSEDSD